MAVIKLGKENFDNSTIITHATRSFSWSHTKGVISGNVHVYAERSDIEKDVTLTIQEQGKGFGSSAVVDLIELADKIALSKAGAAGTGSNPQDISALLGEYLNIIPPIPPSARKKQFRSITRHVPTPVYSHSSSMKSFARKVLFDDYKVPYPDTQYAYNNYHCLNFFTGNMVPSDSALIYPAFTSSYNFAGQLHNVDPPCRPPANKFGISFWINPKYDGLFDPYASSPGTKNHFRAGTIMHMSSCYAVSLVTGSRLDQRDRPDSYRIMLQLSHSAEIPPSKLSLNFENNTRGTAFPGEIYDDLVFLSSPQSLNKNHWQHVAITWGAHKHNLGTGSFYINGHRDSTFVCTASNWLFGEKGGFPDPTGRKNFLKDPDALFIGNFYEGANSIFDDSEIAKYFNPTVASIEGLSRFPGVLTGDSDPQNVSLHHPLNAEVHDIRIYQKHLDSDEIKEIMTSGPRFVITQSRTVYNTVPDAGGVAPKLPKPTNPDLMFYLPPFFIKEGRARRVATSPFTTIRPAKTINPNNARLSFQTNIHEINLENFCRDLVRGEYPRLFHLTGAIRSPTTVIPDGYGYDVTPSGDKVTMLFGGTDSERKDINKRNLTILPCDNGLFRPNFFLLATGSIPPPTSKHDPIYNATLNVNIVSGTALDKYTNDRGNLDFSYINISDQMFIDPDKVGAWDSLENGIEELEKMGDPAGMIEFLQAGFGTTPFKMGAAATIPNPNLAPPVIYKTRDGSSNAIVMFNLPSLFYGDRVQPGTLKLRGGLGTIKIRNDDIQDTLNMVLRDNGMGGIYRADALTAPAKWNSVGTILYNEGYPIILSPHLKDFGELEWDMTFSGDRNVHVLEIMIPCPAGMVNSSSNPTFTPIPPTDYALETSKEFVYITGLNFHDDNLNVIARTNLAQPAVKRDEDHYMFRVKIDF